MSENSKNRIEVKIDEKYTVIMDAEGRTYCLRNGEPKDLVDTKLIIAMACKIEELEAKLLHRHILGKVYDVTADSINKLVGELEEVKEENKQLREALIKIRDGVPGACIEDCPEIARTALDEK